MSLPSDENVLNLANKIIQQFDKIFGLHPGFRPAHAKGVMLTGTFTPSVAASSLTQAPHVLRPETPVTVRFSNSTGLPLLPDNAPEANPRGMAIRFHLADHVHTDIVTHSFDGFPTRNGEDFLEFLLALASSGPDVASPKPIELFLGNHPETLAFVQAPKPFPVSFATEAYFGVSSFQFTNSKGETCVGRYRFLPEKGLNLVPEDKVASLSANYLFEELHERIKTESIRFKILVQPASADDEVNDATVHWPENRPLLEFGTVELTQLVENNPAEEKHIIFDPIPRVEGIEPTADPLFELRAAVYLISGRRRRKA